MFETNQHGDENDDDMDTFHNALSHIPTSSSSTSLSKEESISHEEDQSHSLSYWQSTKNWINAQRDRSRREALERQVEKQRRILLEETMKLNHHSNRKICNDEYDDHLGGLDQNAAFQSITQTNNGISSATANSVLGLGGICSGPYDSDEDNDYIVEEDKTIHDNNEMFYSSKETEDEFRICSPQYTQSGGLQVELKFLDHFQNPKSQERVNIELEDNYESKVPFILTPEQLGTIATSGLPASLIFAKWKRLYCLQRDGDSFVGAFLRKVENHERTLLVIQTTQNEVMGAYANSKWESQGGSVGASFYGSALSCLFSLDKDSGEIKVFKWTGKNRYIQVCDVYTKLLAFGGGGKEGEFGLALEDDFRRGSTGPCETFDNPPLCKQDRFEIMNFEVWGFAVGLF